MLRWYDGTGDEEIIFDASPSELTIVLRSRPAESKATVQIELLKELRDWSVKACKQFAPEDQ